MKDASVTEFHHLVPRKVSELKKCVDIFVVGCKADCSIRDLVLWAECPPWGSRNVWDR